MSNTHTPAAGFFGKRTDIADIFHHNICALPDQNAFEEDFTSYIKRLAKETKEKAAIKA